MRSSLLMGAYIGNPVVLVVYGLRSGLVQLGLRGECAQCSVQPLSSLLPRYSLCSFRSCSAEAPSFFLPPIGVRVSVMIKRSLRRSLQATPGRAMRSMVLRDNTTCIRDGGRPCVRTYTHSAKKSIYPLESSIKCDRKLILMCLGANFLRPNSTVMYDHVPLAWVD